MPWKIAHAHWLLVEANRIQSIIEAPRYWRRVWTPQSLQEELAVIGLNYSLPECQELNDELHKRGIVVDVPVAVVAEPAVAVADVAQPVEPLLAPPPA